MVRTPSRAWQISWSALLDVVAIVVFAIAGRSNHAEELGVLEVASTAWPFLAALALGWVVNRAWRRPAGILVPGVLIWLTTLAGGMVLRLATGQTAQLPFVLVAAIALGILIVGWRGLYLVANRWRERAGETNE